jgi:hypothetical protein
MIRTRYLFLAVGLVFVFSLVACTQRVTLTITGIPSSGSTPGQLRIDALGKVFFDEYGASKIGLLDPHANTISERSIPHAPSGTSPARVR